MDSVEFFCFIVMPLTMIVVVIAAIIIATIAGRTADYFSRENIEKRHRKNAQNRMRVERLGYTDEDGFVCNIEVWWNSKYGQPENGVKRLAEEAAKVANSTAKEKGFANATMHFYVDSEGFYTVSNRYHSSNFFTISAIYQYFGNGYEEALYVGNFYSFNDARENFNSLCMSYYKEVAGIKE